MLKKILLLAVFITICNAQQSPTLLQYLTDRYVNLYGGLNHSGTVITGIYPQLVGRQFPVPTPAAHWQALGDYSCGQSQYATGSCVFTLAQAEAQVDSLCLMMAGASASNKVIYNEVSSFIWVDNQTFSQNARTLVTSAYNYMINISTACSGFKLAIGFGAVFENIANAYTDNTKATRSCSVLSGSGGTAIGAVSDITNCMSTQTFSWLTSKSVFQYAAGGFGVSNFTAPYRLTIWHEPTSSNSFLGFDGVTQGSPTQWTALVSAVGAQVFAVSSTIPIALGFDSVDGTNYQNPMITASGGHVTQCGYDIYNDLFQTGGQLQTFQTMIVAAKTNGIVYPNLFANEMWTPAWTPTGQTGDGNSYEGVGNCTWNNEDSTRQSLTGMALWAVWEGLSEIDYFNAAFVTTTCVWGVPGNGNDQTTSSYQNVVATNSYGPYPANNPPTKQTKAWRFMYQLFSWFGILQSGTQLPI
jgi:hypothetical protein